MRIERGGELRYVNTHVASRKRYTQQLVDDEFEMLPELFRRFAIAEIAFSVGIRIK